MQKTKDAKIHKTLRLDPRIIKYFEKESEKTGHQFSRDNRGNLNPVRKDGK